MRERVYMKANERENQFEEKQILATELIGHCKKKNEQHQDTIRLVSITDIDGSR